MVAMVHTSGGLSPFPRTGGFLAAVVSLARSVARWCARQSAMRATRRGDRWLNVAGFLLVLCCFALPFNGWSTDPCTGTKLTYLGTDVVVGAAVDVAVDSCDGRPVTGEPSRTDSVPRTFPPLTGLRPFAVAALALAVLGVALAALPWRRIRAVAATATASTAACLVVVTVLASRDVSTPYLGLTKAVSHDLPTGACLAFVLLAALAVGNLGSVIRSPKRSPGRSRANFLGAPVPDEGMP
jgi:hypothetical protein